MDILDFPSYIVEHQRSMCDADNPSLSRVDYFQAYTYFFLFFGVVVAPVVSTIFGFYLFLADRVFAIHWDESFSALHIEDYKSFLRFRIDPETRDLHCTVYGIEKVPRRWKLDLRYVVDLAGREKQPHWKRQYPSKWVADDVDPERDGAARVVDRFTVLRDE